MRAGIAARPSLSEEAMTLRGKREKRTWRRRAFLFFLALFLLSGGLLLRDQCRAFREQAANRALAQQVHKAEEKPPHDSGSAEDASPAADPRREQYRLLWEQNHDFAGWLSIEGTKIDYPVMFTPEEPE